MSTLKQPSIAIAELTEASIAAWLQSNPDFFERHLGLLGSLSLPHRTGGPAISLMERQVSVLRQRNSQLERQLRELVEVARENDELTGRIHRLALALLETSGREQVITVIERELRLGFRADCAQLVLFIEDEAGPAPGPERFVRACARDDAALAPFRTFLQSATPRCGQVRDSQRNFLFGEDSVEIGSVALLPLGPGAATGFLAIGSRDAGHFHPGMGVDFLARLGELLAVALARS